MTDIKIVAVIIGRTSSRCSACGRETMPEHVKHRMNTLYGWSQRSGCGETFTHVTTDMIGDTSKAVTQNMRPDLPWIEYENLPKRRRSCFDPIPTHGATGAKYLNCGRPYCERTVKMTDGGFWVHDED